MICNVVGARPNFMKMAPIVLEMQARGIEQLSVHTGQHYDERMSEVFFDELRMPRPDAHLEVGSGSHAEQTARVMTRFETVCAERRPSLVVVAGDVNSTMACALVASKMGIPVAHVEAGLRSFDRSMPEEINRIVTDSVSDLLFTSEPSGTANLLREGVPEDRVHFVGNCMIDTLLAHREAALRRAPWSRFGLEPQGYGLVTLHRPGAVDSPEVLEGMRRALREIAEDGLPLLFPVHPRTRERMVAGQRDWSPVRLVDPLGYLDFLGLMGEARLVLTDSGGVQEETTALGTPCLTLRPNTERPVTVELGTNRVVGTDRAEIVRAARAALEAGRPVPRAIPRWDGRAAQRTVDVLQTWRSRHRSAA